MAPEKTGEMRPILKSYVPSFLLPEEHVNQFGTETTNSGAGSPEKRPAPWILCQNGTGASPDSRATATGPGLKSRMGNRPPPLQHSRCPGEPLDPGVLKRQILVDIGLLLALENRSAARPRLAVDGQWF